MKKDKIVLFLRFLFGWLTVLLYTSSLFAADTVAIRKEFDYLKSVSREYSAQLQFDFSENKSSFSNRQGRLVVLNMPQLESISARSGTTNKKYFWRLLLCHEMAHQLQYTHGGEVLSRLHNECQADLMAGFLFIRLTRKDYDHLNNVREVKLLNEEQAAELTADVMKTLLAVYGAIYQLGTEYEVMNSHPRNGQRKLALRDGIFYGTLTTYDSLYHAAGHPYYQHSTVAAIMARHKSILNYLPGENVVTWSYRHAKKIVHENNVNCRDIVVRTDIRWDTSSENPFVYYTQNIENIGKKKIIFNYYNQVYTSLRDDPDNALRWDIVSTKSHLVTLAPGATKIIKDSLIWDGDAEMMPSILYPGRPNSLYTCSCADDPPGGSGNYTGIEPAAGNTREPALGVIMKQILESASDFKYFVDGVGLRPGTRSNGRIEYESKRKLPGAISNLVNYYPDESRYELSYDFYFGGDKSKAASITDHLLTEIQNAGMTSSEETNNSERRWLMTFEDREVAELAMYKIGTKYLVVLDFFP